MSGASQFSGRPRRPRILVAGLGNSLLKDDGIGVHAIRELAARKLPRGVITAEIGTAILDGLHLFERADKVLAIDAMQAGGRPGEIYSFTLDDVENPPVKPSLHDFGLRGAFDFLPAHRPEVVVLGVEPAEIDMGLELTPQVAGSLPRLVEEAMRIVERWRAVAAAGCHSLCSTARPRVTLSNSEDEPCESACPLCACLRSWGQ